jgi:Tfp pilus assembly PilM family ATPase/Tfp pilus assembly protein PilN
MVIRTKEIELLAISGKSVSSRVRVPIEGKEDKDLIRAIQKALSVSGLEATKKLAVAIPTQDVLFRYFTIPAVPKAELDNAVQFEARKYIPFKTDVLIWDYHVIRSSRSPNTLEVVFAAMPRDMFRRVQEILTASGVATASIEPSLLGLSRLVDPPKGSSPAEFTCVVDVEPEAAHLAIVRSSMPYLARDIMFFATPDALAPVQPGQAPATTPPAAAPAMPVPSVPEALDAVDPRARRLLSELSVSMDFFMREHPSTTIPRVFLFGDESLVAPWCRWLSDQLHCQVVLGTTLVESKIQGELPLAFASALGLLQASKDPSVGTLDFLRRSLLQKGPGRPGEAVEGFKEFIQQPKVLASLAGVVAGVLFAIWSLCSMMVQTEQKALNQIIASKADTGWGTASMTQQGLDGLKSKATEQTAWLKDLMDHRINVAVKLDALARTLPDGIWLTELTYNNEMKTNGKQLLKMSIDGACFLGEAGKELSAIQRFEQDMKKNEVFLAGFSSAQMEQVNVEFVRQQQNQEQYTYRSFQLNCASSQKL